MLLFYYLWIFSWNFEFGQKFYHARITFIIVLFITETDASLPFYLY